MAVAQASAQTSSVSQVICCCRYDEDAALTFGKAVSGMLAQSKGRRLGIFEEKVHYLRF